MTQIKSRRLSLGVLGAGAAVEFSGSNLLRWAVVDNSKNSAHI
jgi:hypothetical protein